MKFRFFFHLSLIFVLYIGAVRGQTVVFNYAEWNHNDECGVQFDIPPEFRKVKFETKDSCGRKYQGRKSLFELNAMGYITPDASRKYEYSSRREFMYKITAVDGIRAELITYYDKSPPKRGFKYGAVLFFPETPDDGGNLTFWTHSKTREERESVMRIFQTARFKRKKIAN